MHRDHTPLGAPTWIDLMSADTERAREFYGGLFGWECSEANPDFGGYANFSLDGTLVAGLMGKMEESLPDIWSVYLEVADADASAAAAKDHGGQIFAGPHPVGDLGEMVVSGDNSGALIGMWQSGTHAGFGVHNEPGAPAWFELLTPAYDDALAYYRDVFGWTLQTNSDADGFRYSTLKIGELEYAGIMDSTGHVPDGTPPMWSVYIEVASADESSSTLGRLGGTIVRPAEDTPYGRLVSCADPMGATFNMIQAPVD